MHDLAQGAAAALRVPPALRRSPSWDDFLDGLPVGLSICDGDGVLVHYNRRAAELWGWSPPVGDRRLRFGGAWRIRRPDGAPLARAEAAMGEALRAGALRAALGR